MTILPPLVKDKRGMRFGRLVVKEFDSSRNGKARWRCLCDCGNETVVTGTNLRPEGKTQSCGCFQKENASRVGKLGIVGTIPQSKTRKRIFKIWTGMIERCTNQCRPAYSSYGGRGIGVCKEWLLDFDSFYFWATSNGYADELTIDRIDNNDGYFPENCRWITKAEQSRNTRRTRLHTAFEETKCMAEWERDSRFVVSKPTVETRLANGWDFEKAISTPTAETYRNRNYKRRTTA